MSSRVRRFVGFAVTAVVVAVLFWLPKAAQAGITLNAID
jgi:hypothetical protein